MMFYHFWLVIVSIRHFMRSTNTLMRLIEYITTLRKGQGNPIRVSIISIHDEACRVVDVANHRHEDGIPLSLLQSTRVTKHHCRFGLRCFFFFSS